MKIQKLKKKLLIFIISLIEIKKQGLKQLEGYSNSKKLISSYNIRNMKKLLIIVIGKKEVKWILE